jgi:hypothetical protein
MSTLGITTVGELAAVPLPRLEAAVGEETAAWLSKLSRGQDEEEVKQRLLAKSCSCGKTFRGAKALRTLKDVEHWLLQLGKELEERLVAERQANQRLPQLLTVSIDSAIKQQQQQQGSEGGSGLGQRQLHGQHQVKIQQLQRQQQQLEEEDVEGFLSGDGDVEDDDLQSHFNQEWQQNDGGAGKPSEDVGGRFAGPRGKAAVAMPSGVNVGGRAIRTSAGGSSSGGGGGASARATAANWRAGMQNSSRSCPLGRPTTKSMANAALGMVRKWAADR